MLVRPDGLVLNGREVLQDFRTNGLVFHLIGLHQSTVRICRPTAVLTGESRTPRNDMEVAHTLDSLRSIRARSVRSTFNAPLSVSFGTEGRSDPVAVLRLAVLRGDCGSIGEAHRVQWLDEDRTWAALFMTRFELAAARHE
jgi:hypothetical protein